MDRLYQLEEDNVKTRNEEAYRQARLDGASHNYYEIQGVQNPAAPAYHTGGGKHGKGTKGKFHGTKGNGKSTSKGKSKGSKGKQKGDQSHMKGGKTNYKGKHHGKGTSNTSYNTTDTGYYDALGRRIPSPHRGKGKGKYGPTGKGKGTMIARLNTHNSITAYAIKSYA